MRGFAITFERWDEEALEAGETNDRGFEVEPSDGWTLKDCAQWLALHRGCRHATDADCYPIVNPRWLSFDGGTDYRTGTETKLDLHIPAGVTTASRARIARYFGLAA